MDHASEHLLFLAEAYSVPYLGTLPFTNRLTAQMYFYDEMPCGIRESRGVQQDRDIGFCSGRVV